MDAPWSSVRTGRDRWPEGRFAWAARFVVPILLPILHTHVRFLLSSPHLAYCGRWPAGEEGTPSAEQETQTAWSMARRKRAFRRVLRAACPPMRQIEGERRLMTARQGRPSRAQDCAAQAPATRTSGCGTGAQRTEQGHAVAHLRRLLRAELPRVRHHRQHARPLLVFAAEKGVRRRPVRRLAHRHRRWSSARSCCSSPAGFLERSTRASCCPCAWR